MNLGVAGVTVGHSTDAVGRTGCTVVRLPAGTVASGEIRGGAPATREWGVLGVDRLVAGVDAVVLSGGSAFGLAAADGVVGALEAQGRGFETAHGRVPIVVGLALYDLGVGSASARPDAAAGAAALDAATASPATGSVGAGTGATIGKWRGADHSRPGGVGVASISDGVVTVDAIVAVNAVGDLADGSVEASVLAGTFSWPGAASALGGTAGGNTVIGAIVTDAHLDKPDCLVVAQGAHDGLARAVSPPHMRTDGDAFVAAATGVHDVPVDLVRYLAVVATEQAIRGAVASL